MKPPPSQSAANGERDSYYHPINQMLRSAGLQPYSRGTELTFGSELPPTFSTPEDAAAFEEWLTQQKKARVKAQEEAEEAQSQADLQAIATAPKPPSFDPASGPPPAAFQPPPQWRSNVSGRPVAPSVSVWRGPPAGILERVLRGQQSNRERLLGSSYIGRAFREGR